MQAYPGEGLSWGIQRRGECFLILKKQFLFFIEREIP